MLAVRGKNEGKCVWGEWYREKSASWKPRVRTGNSARKQAAEATAQKPTLRPCQVAFDVFWMRAKSTASDVFDQTSTAPSATLLGMRVGE